MQLQLNISYALDVAYRQDEETGDWIGWCPLLRLYSQGETEGEADEALQDAIVEYLRHCYARRILDDLLHCRGFQAISPAEAAASMPNQSSNSILIEAKALRDFPHRSKITVPLHLIQQSGIGIGDANCPA